MMSIEIIFSGNQWHLLSFCDLFVSGTPFLILICISVKLCYIAKQRKRTVCLFQWEVLCWSIWLQSAGVNGIIHSSGLILFQLIPCDHQIQNYHRILWWIQWSSWSHFLTALPPAPFPFYPSLNTCYFSPDSWVLSLVRSCPHWFESSLSI